jgi:hypothetical protein
MPKINLTVAIARAVDEDNPLLATAIVDALRFKRGLTYQQILTKVREVRPTVTDAAWDALLYRGDLEEEAR